MRTVLTRSSAAMQCAARSKQRCRPAVVQRAGMHRAAVRHAAVHRAVLRRAATHRQCCSGQSCGVQPRIGSAAAGSVAAGSAAAGSAAAGSGAACGGAACGGAAHGAVQRRIPTRCPSSPAARPHPAPAAAAIHHRRPAAPLPDNEGKAAFSGEPLCCLYKGVWLLTRVR